MNEQEVKTMTVPVATYVADECRRIAEALGVSVDALCAYFFACGVVHT